MSQSSSERLRALRHVLAHCVEAEQASTLQQSPVALGAAAACRLDGALGGGLRRGVLHEIVAARPGDATAAVGFASALATCLSRPRKSPVVWILERSAESEGGGLYAPGLAAHGLDPSVLVLVRTGDARESLWAAEEALRSPTPAVVVAEIWGLERRYDLAASRRLLLAAVRSGTPGLLLAAGLAGRIGTMSSGAETRFEIRAGRSRALPSAADRVPLPGLPVWNVRLAKLRVRPDSRPVDCDRFMPVVWDPREGCFRDALPFPLDAFPAARSTPARGGARALASDRCAS